MARGKKSGVARMLSTLALFAVLALSGCSLSLGTADGSAQSGESTPSEVSSTETTAAASSKSSETSDIREREEEMPTEIIMSANGRNLVVELAGNSSAEALVELLADGNLTLSMEDYAGMEKVGSIGTRLPTNDESMSTSAGDVILYQGDKLVVYYGNNSWNFTRLGKIKDASARELKEILGSDDVEVTLSLAR